MEHRTVRKALAGAFLCLLFICLAASLILLSWRITRRKDSYIKNGSFLEAAQNDPPQILFLGSSHVINGVDPVRLWDRYGFTSYNLGGHGSLMQATYWELRLALESMTPEVAVIDTYMIDHDYRYLDKPGKKADPSTGVDQLHLNLDAFPLSKVKLEAIDDMISSPSTKLGFIWDYSIYHSRWSELEENDLLPDSELLSQNGLMGAEERFTVAYYDTVTPVYPDSYNVLDDKTVGTKYLKKIIKLCRENGIKPVITYLPFQMSEYSFTERNTAYDLAESLDVPFLDLTGQGNTVINLRTDCNDDGHLNVQGMVRVTDAIGEWLSENTELADLREDEGHDKWNELSAERLASLQSMSTEQSDLASELLILSDTVHEGISPGIVIYINSGSIAWSDDSILDLISDISGSTRVREAAEGDLPYIMISSPDCTSSGWEVNEALDDESLSGIRTPMGTFSYRSMSGLFRMLVTEEDPDTNYLYDDDRLYDDIRIILFNPATGDLISRLYYISEPSGYRKD